MLTIPVFSLSSVVGIAIAGFGWTSQTTLGAIPGAAGREIVPFNGRDLSGWRQPVGDWRAAASVTLDREDDRRFVIQSGAGALVNGPQGRTVDLLTEYEHGDVEVQLEFVVPRGSNSGVYFQGRYEIQIFDSWGVDQPSHSDCGGIYERWKDDRGFEGHAPRVNASKPPGTWQRLHVIFRAPRFDAEGRKIANARFVRVLLNDELIHENVKVTGPTRAARFENDEKPTGPLMLQGDHGPVAFRNLRLIPITASPPVGPVGAGETES
jgi:hypothetical protein